MKKSIITITLMLGVLLALAPVAQGKGELNQEFKVKSGQKIEIEMKEGGSLDVQGWDKNLVKVTCIAHRNALDDWDIEIEETGFGLRLEAELKSRHIKSNNFEVRLMVPRKFDISTRSGGGGIVITGVTGNFKGKTGGGQILLREVAGHVRLSTGGGWIEIEDSDLNGKVSSGGGGGMVRNVTGNVKVTSGGGAISYENVRNRDGDLRGPGRYTDDKISSGTIIQDSAGGSIRLRQAPEGAIVETGGGDIRILNASRMVKAKTGGGDIRIEIDNGSVKATTGAGDIEVTVVSGLGEGREGIELRTGHGEINVILPADASVELDLDLSYTRNSSRNYEIDSDFDLEIEHTDKWETRHGSPRKHIYGTATVNGGKHKVLIRCVNGDINIEKR